MNKYLLLSIGFTPPTDDIMQAWGAWFNSIKENVVEFGGCMNGKEITKAGTAEIPFDLNALTGYTIIQAESMAKAEEIASACPIITSMQVYELRQHGG